MVTEWGAAFSFGDDSMNQLGTGNSVHNSRQIGLLAESNSQMAHLSEEYAGGSFQRSDSLSSNTTDVVQSVLFPNLVKVDKTASGYAHTLALVQQCRNASASWNSHGKGESSGEVFGEVNCVYSWGWDSADQLGHGGFEGVRTGLPAYVQGFQGEFSSKETEETTDTGSDLMDPILIAAGRVHSVVLTRANNVYTWGSSSNGRLGYSLFEKDMQQTTTAVPQKVHIPDELNVSEIIDVKCGFDHTLLLVK